MFLSSSMSPGGQGQSAGSSAQRAAHLVDGVVHGVLLHAVLDALWHCGSDGHLRSVWTGQSHGQHGAVHPCQVQHRCQPSYLRVLQQPGES